MAKGRRKQGLKKVAEKFGGFRNNAYLCTVQNPNVGIDGRPQGGIFYVTT
jgi:hypothetical protein